MQSKLDELTKEIAAQKNQGEMLELLMDDVNRTIDDQDDRINGMSSKLDDRKKGGNRKYDWTKVEERLRRTEEQLESIPIRDVEKLKIRRGQLEFRMSLMADKQVDYERKIDNLLRLLPISQRPQSETTNIGYSPEVMASIAKHWTNHVIEVARTLAPPFPDGFCEAVIKTVSNIPTVSAAAAAILNLATDLVNLAASARNPGNGATCSPSPLFGTLSNSPQRFDGHRTPPWTDMSG
jgi:hypothetical protein